MSLVRKEVEGVFRRAMNSNSQGIHQIKFIVTHQSSSLNKKNETNEGNMLQSDNDMVSNVRKQNFQIDTRKFDKFDSKEFFSYYD